MSSPTPTRRRLLKAGAGVACATALAGCRGVLDSGGPAVARARPLSAAPAGTSFVFHANVDALLADDVLRDEIDDLLQEAGSTGTTTAPSVEAGLDQFEESEGVDLRDVSALVAFGGYAPGTAAGSVVWTDWTIDDLEGALSEGSAEVEREEYRGRTLLQAASGAIADLGDGTFALADREGVERVVDVATGEADAVGGRVREGFDAATEGPIRLAFEAPPGLGQAGRSSSSTVDPAAFGSLTHGYGSYVTQGSDRSASVTLAADSSDGATEMRDALRTLLSEARRDLQQYPDSRPNVEELRDVADSVEIAQQGTSVTVSVDRGEVVPLVLVAVLGSFVLGLGAQSQQSVTPRATFDFNYDSDASLVTVTHVAGDSIRADELFVSGQGLTSVSGADMGGRGTWAGSASGSVEGQPAVVAGDSVDVGVSGHDYVTRVVWRAADGSSSAELATDRGPDA